MWEALKLASGKLLKGAAGWKVYAGVAAAAVLALGAVLVWFNTRINAAYEAGQKSVQVEQLAGEVKTLKNLADANKESNDAIAKNLEALGGVAARVDYLERVRQRDLASFDRRLQRAAEPAVRAYAGQAERDIAALERSRDGFAQEALRASTAAWGYRDTLQARRDALNARRSAAEPEPKE